ncbi:pyridoxal-phosphate dependent enzyme [Pelagibius marinus]|uniref:pyridoxal-phosphate dependent enzyme n=1 Tax=Pelagibius marinus TaxID=2762760 RepID=UPI001872FAEC|nr:pyridoxal-phosphate dependent enzyme [Pelagibius marinus]
MKYESILETVGGTPAVRINKLAPEGVNLYAKLEAFNPMGSVKDRLALGVIEDAERSGALKPGQTVVEATSGNTGIGLAMVCAEKGYPLVIVMAENFSVERRKLMRFLGAKVVLTPAAEKGTGMLNKAVELSEKHGWFLCRQFENEANADFHSRTTAREILEDFAETPLDYWVTGSGTGGTLKGVSRVLKAESPNTQIIVCEPDNVPILGSGIPMPETPGESHPLFRPHLMQGWTPDFIPRLTGDALAEHHVDRIVPVGGEVSLRLARELALKEGILCGITGGATLAGALQIAKEAPQGSTILCMLPDTGERYLSTVLFEHISVDMTAEEIEISKSTPTARFDQPSAPPAAKPEEAKPAAAAATDDAEAEAYLAEVLGDKDKPVVMFALEWCEFCWSVRRFFARLGIDYRSVDLDSVALQENNMGGRIRAAVSARTGIRTIPQIFVGGTLVGGCTEVFDAYKSGELQKLLDESGAAYDRKAQLDPYGFFPAWLQSRQAVAQSDEAAE